MKPLGYWLKHIDGLLESGFERLLASEGLTRRHWQVLNTIAAGQDVNTALAPFGDDFQLQVHDLTARGWLDGGLTTAGREAHRRIEARVHAFRAKITDGISDADYVTLVNLLERVATNAAEAR